MLLPFAGLVALGFSLLKDPEPLELPSPPPVVLQLPPEPPPAPPRPPPPPEPPLPPPLPTTVQVVAPPEPSPPPVDGKPPAELSAAAKRLPIIAAVEPLVQQCFKDVSDRVRDPLRVTVAFSPTLDGGFENVVLKQTSWQDPILSACIIDSFEDARFVPSGLTPRRQTYTFAFPPPDGGR